jgi:hypothetical protein
MYLAELETTQCPNPGDELRSRDAEKADGSGKVVDAVIREDGHCSLLFIAQIAKADANELVLCDQPEARMILKPLPYSID